MKEKIDFTVVLGRIGVALVIAGAGMIYTPAAFILSGIFLFVGAVVATEEF